MSRRNPAPVRTSVRTPVRTSVPATAGLAVAVLALTALTGCTQNATSDPDSEANPDARRISVTSSADSCELSATEAPAGSLTFSVKNTGTEVTEFYLYAEDGESVVSEVENIGPGLTRDMVVAAAAGSYVTACKPGMLGDGIRADFTVTESDTEVTPAADEELITQATKRYGDYVYGQAELLVEQTEKFAKAYIAGRDNKARALYPVARTHWERIETVAESFADLDPVLDAREADLEPGQEWTGWHRLEKDLWPQRAANYEQLKPAQREALATKLVADTEELEERIEGLSFTAAQIANGARGLMEEVATGKITGEEEYWSRTDLWDFQANVDGAHEAFEALEPILGRRDAELVKTLDERFAALQSLLDAHRIGTGFAAYDDVSEQDIKALADAVNAVSEPLSQVGAVVMGG
ncbi:MAG: iron uptake system protein EfeO [Nocardioides sp.]